MSAALKMALAKAPADQLWSACDLAKFAGIAEARVLAMIGSNDAEATLLPDVVVIKGRRAPALLFSTQTARDWKARCLRRARKLRAEQREASRDDAIYENTLESGAY